MSSLKDREYARLREQERLDRRFDAPERNRRGQFATPPSLARAVAVEGLRVWGNRPDGIRFLDPAIGTGAFYGAALEVFPDGAIERAAGFELDPELAAAARRVWRGTGLRVIPGDFTRFPPPRATERFHLILANPPYVRHHHLSPEEKARLRGRVAGELGMEVSGLAGLYCYFLLLCDAWLCDHGLACWLIPSEFMNVAYGAAARRYLAERVRLIHIHRFRPGDVQFPDALVSSAVVIFQKRNRPFGRGPLFSLGGSLARPEIRERVARKELASDEKWMRRPALPTRLAPRDGEPALGDLFDIKRGIATGSNDFFILPKAETRRRGIPRRFTRPILPGPRRLLESVIETTRDGYPRVSPPMALIDCDLDESEIRTQAFGLWSYLQEGRRRNVHQGYLASRRSPWYSQEKRPPPPFLCTYMGRAGRNGREPFRFLWNKSQATATNVYLLLYPKAPLAEALRARPALHQKVWEALQRIASESLVAEGRVYGGGLYKLEPRELARAPAGPVAHVVRTEGVDRL